MKISSEQEMLDLGKKLAKDLKTPVVELIGDIGAGKTTLVRGLAESLGAKTKVTSPSFTISKSYALPNGKTLTHYDFYRLDDVGLMKDDLEEKIEDGHIVLVEWGKSIEDILPSNRTTIEIKLQDDGSREIIINNNQGSTIEGLPETAAEDEHLSPITDRPLGRGRPKGSMGATKRVEKSSIWLQLDTSSPTTVLKLNDKTYEWDSGRDLAEKLLSFIHDKLQENHADWHDISKITFMSGPGSFTGLRIGAAVVNALASELKIPLYDHHGKKHQIILPDYGRAANISQPKK